MRLGCLLLSAALGLAGCGPRTIDNPLATASEKREASYRIGVQLVIHALPPTTAHYDDGGVFHMTVGDQLQATARYIAESEDFRHVTDHPGTKWLITQPPRIEEVARKPGRFKAVAPGTARLGCVYTDPNDHEKYVSNTIELEVASGE